MGMQLQLTGAVTRSGTGKESGKAYVMSRLFTLSPIQPQQLGGMTVDGAGFETGELETNPACVSSLKGCNFPCRVDAEIATKVIGGKVVITVQSVTLLK